MPSGRCSPLSKGSITPGGGPQIDTGSLIVTRLLTHPVSETGELKEPLVSSFDQDSESLLPHAEFTELFPGDGAPDELRVGSRVVVQFRGLTWNDGTVFDTTWQSGQPPIPLPLGQDSLVDAWDFELPGHTVGSRLLPLTPPEEGYGTEGNPDVGIPPHEPLLHMIDVLGIH